MTNQSARCLGRYSEATLRLFKEDLFKALRSAHPCEVCGTLKEPIPRFGTWIPEHHASMHMEVSRLRMLFQILLRAIKFAFSSENGRRLVCDVDTGGEWDGLPLSPHAGTWEESNLLARTDTLTGLDSRSVFLEQVERHYALADRRGRPLTVITIDLQEHERRNDAMYMHLDDEVLRAFGILLRSFVRAGEVAARIGGKQFAIVLPEIGLAEARAFAECIQEETREIQFASGRVTANIGIACKDASTRNFEHLVARAQQAMNRVKAVKDGQIAVHGYHAEDYVDRRDTRTVMHAHRH